MKVQRTPLPALATAVVAVLCLCATATVAHASARVTPRQDRGLFAAEKTPLRFGTSTTTAHAASSGGSSVLRTIVALLAVIALIYAVAWVMRRVRRGREGKVSGSGLATVATLPLSGGRSLHLVRAANDLILVGASEHGVTPIRSYTEEEARACGLLGDPDADALTPASAAAADSRPRAGATAQAWQPAASWQGDDEWRTLSDRPTPLHQAVEQLRRLTVRS